MSHRSGNKRSFMCSFTRVSLEGTTDNGIKRVTRTNKNTSSPRRMGRMGRTLLCSGCVGVGISLSICCAVVVVTCWIMYRRRHRATLGLGVASLSSSFSTTLSFRTTTSAPSRTYNDSVRSDARATAAKLKSKYETTGSAQGAYFTCP